MHILVSLRTLLFVSLVALSACDSAEERAEKYYQSGMALLAAGDVDRALIEFRNVFKLNGQHKEARLAYARVQRERGQLREAYGQYLRVVEQYPDNLEGQKALAEMAVDLGDWDEVERHGREAARLAPTDISVLSVIAALDYRAALLAKDDAGKRKAADAARQILATSPDSLIARRVLIDQLATSGDTVGALEQTELAIAQEPDMLEFHILKLRLIAEQQDDSKLGPVLQDVFTRFPDNEQIRDMLLSWFIQQGDIAGAAGVLRQLAEKTPNEAGPWLSLVQFYRQAGDLAASRAELDRLIAAGDANVLLYRASRAALQFEEDQNPKAIAELEEILRDAPSSSEMNNIKLALAKMLLVTGNSVGARARVEEVLAEDPTNVEALKMSASWLIDEDKPGEAIIALRTALDQNPRDPEILTLMAEAHERDGSRELAGERYALAVEVSGNGVSESLRYASYLIADNRLEAAATVLEDALRVAPVSVPLLAALADVRMRESDWNRTAEIIAQLRAIGSEEAARTADGLEAGLMLRQEKVDETVNFLQGLIDGNDNDTAVIATIVQARVRSGDLKAARGYLTDQLAKNPNDPSLRFLSAGLYILEDDPATAETIYRALITELPTAEQPVRVLYALLTWQGRTDDATAVLNAGLTQIPNSTTLRMMRAGELEKANDINGAIAIYEAIYAENTDNMLVANNLASLIGAHRPDPESLERAFAIARRLRGLDVPAFQDTYGWIEYRRGNYAEALASLEPAARGLPGDPLVQYHLGMTYLALERTDDARKQLTAALEIAGNNPLPQFEEARKALAGLPSTP